MKKFSTQYFAKICRSLWLLLLPLCTAIPAQSNESNNNEQAKFLINALRTAQAVENKIEIKGQLRQDRRYGRAKIRLNLAIDGSNFRYRFLAKDANYELFIKRQPHDFKILTRKNNEEFRSLTSPELAAPLWGTDIVAYDLSLGFLYWPRVKMLSDKAVINNRFFYKIELTTNDKSLPYRRAVVWVDKKYHTINKCETYTPDGKLIKRMLIVSLRRHKSSWTVRQMRVERFNHKNGKLIGRTYFESFK